MKLKNRPHRLLKTALLGLTVAASASLGLAQNTSPTNTFDTAQSTTSFVNWWGLAATMTWDSTLDAKNDPNSGSVRYVENFVGAEGEQFMTFFTIANRWGWDDGYTLDATTYTNLSFDIKVDPSSSQRKDNADYGPLEVGLVTKGWGQTYLSPTKTIPLSATNWTHIDYPLTPSLANIDKVVGFFVKMWSNGGHTNTLTFNIDNYMITKPTVEVAIPPPTLGITTAGTPGVRVTMDNDASTAQWQRDAFVTPANSGPYHWTGQGAYPVTYSFTISDFPPPTLRPGLEAHMYLVNGDTGASQATGGSPDWGAPDVFIVRLENMGADADFPNGGYRAQIQWKTNYPNANSTNVPVNVTTATSIMGTWNLTFTDSTHGTLSGPGIAGESFTLPEDAVVNNFSPSTSFIQYGVFKADGANDGHNNQAYGTYKSVKFTGVAAAFEDDFSGSTLTNKYVWRKTSSSAVQHIPPGTAWMVNWTLPAKDFNFEVAPAINGSWTLAPVFNTYQNGPKNYGMVAASSLPAGNMGLFRMVKRPYEKLLVLLPGETVAPYTATGRTGTPDQQSVGGIFEVTVMAVDAKWNSINSVTNLVTLTSTDPNVALPGDASFVNGIAKFIVGFNTPGTWTFTASDATEPTKQPNTSTPLRVQ